MKLQKELLESLVGEEFKALSIEVRKMDYSPEDKEQALADIIDMLVDKIDALMYDKENITFTRKVKL